MKKLFALAFIFTICLLAVLLCGCGPTPTGITVSTPPASDTVVQGGTPDFKGGEVTVTYKDGTTKTVAMSELTVSGLNVDLVGEQSAVLTYTEDGKSFSVPITVKVVAPTVKKIEVDASAVNTDYIEGQAFSVEGMKVTAFYNDGHEAEVSASSCAVTPATLTTETTSVRITYRRSHVDIPVTVRKKSMTAIRIVNEPNKMEYYVGEGLDTTGLAVAAVFDNGKTELVAESELFFTREDESDYDAPSSETDDTVRIVYEREGVTAYVDLTLRKVLPLTVKSMAFVSEQEPVVCYVGLPFDFTGVGEVFITYVNDTIETVVPFAARFASVPVTSTEENEVFIYLCGNENVKLAVPADVRVDTVKALLLDVYPVKTEYEAGETPDLAGISLTAIYESGRRETIDAANVTTATVLMKNTTEIIVRYGEATCAVPVTVTDPTVELETIIMADSATPKTNYAPGDAVSYDGIAFYLHFSDGTDVEAYEPAAECVSAQLFVGGELEASDVILAGTSAILYTVHYTDETEREFVGEVILEIALS